jgi:peptidoglycan/LPS O-acetylase OafA/YrhL
MLQTGSAPLEQNIIFFSLLVTAILLSLGKKPSPQSLSLEVTTSLKGFAILTILFGHIGYFLFANHSFLHPLSSISGVGVDLFLLLSGYGLAISSLKKNYLPLEFYRRRIGKIFLPLWIVLIIILLLDAFFLHTFYTWQIITQNFLGFYPSADIYLDLNSPLWYLTLILFYYLIFPWIFNPKKVVLSGTALAIISLLIISLNLPVTAGVQHLYQLHYLAFPLGIILAGLSSKFSNFFNNKIFNSKKSPQQSRLIRYLLISISAALFFFSLRPEENKLIYQLLSLLSATSITAIFILTKLRFKLLEVFGNYSYEIYLLHWPLLYRYDFLYPHLPAAISTALYLAILLALGYLLQKTNLSSIKNSNTLNSTK